MISDLIESPYSLALDETTDAFNSSYLAVCAMYLPPQRLDAMSFKNPVTKLISIIKLKERKTASEIYAKLKEEIFYQHPKLLTNIIGLVTDQGSNMVGQHNGLGALMTRDIPHLVKFQDLSRLYNLVCQKSLKAYPPCVIANVRDICSHFNHSTIWMEKLKSIQTQHGFETPLAILSFSPTCWLSLLECVNRIIKLWEPLKEYYKNEQEEDAETYFTAK